MPVLNRQLYISYSTLIGDAPFPVDYGYVVWVTDDPDSTRVSMPALPDPISGAATLLGDVQVVRRSDALALASRVAGTFATELPGAPTPGIIEPSIVGDAEPAVVGTTFTAAEGGWVLATNSAGQELPIEEYRYQWRRNGVDIAGATNQAYQAQIADAGTTITCAIRGVTFGQAVSATEVVTNGIAVTSDDVLGDPLILFDAAIGVLEAPGDPVENLDYVEIWEDQGTAGTDAEESAAFNKPLYLAVGGIDGYPTVDFLASSEQRMAISGLVNASTNWTLYVALYDNAGTGDACILDVETGPLRFMLSSIAEGDNVSLFDGAWRTFGASLADAQVLTWVLDGSANLCRLFRGRTQIGSDQAYTPRAVGGSAMLAALTSLSSFADASISRLALYPVAHNATLRTEVWDLWNMDFPTYL
jgi:hypothetical protein